MQPLNTWAGLGACTIVDVESPRRIDAIDISTEFADLNYVVQDQPVIPGAAEQLPPELKGRIGFAPYDFSNP
ncbi:hypothetical protein Daus18300_004548 [Diaporthe australafricana]|uniref:Uncharacterized protein n=1 Tax=Diaporthe australafricana TaxID=127596 RepID=A0ABR3X7L2_9PEZI